MIIIHSTKFLSILELILAEIDRVLLFVESGNDSKEIKTYFRFAFPYQYEELPKSLMKQM